MVLKISKHTFRIIIFAATIILAPIITIDMYRSTTNRAAAASLTTMSDTLTRNYVSVASDHDVKFRVATAISATTQTITIGFATPAFGNTGVDYTDIDLLYGSNETQVNSTCSSSCTSATLAAAAGVSTWGAAFSANNLVLTYPTSTGTAVNANDYVRILIGKNATGTTANAQMTNPSTIGTKTISITTSVGDSGNIGVLIINTPNSDQIGVTATVDPTLSFTITALSLNFGSLVSNDTKYATNGGTGSTTVPASGQPTTLTASTNGNNGVLISVYDQGDGSNPGLWAAAPISERINAVASSAVSDGAAEYGVYAKNASNLSIDAGFDNNGVGDLAISRSAQAIASSSGPVANGSIDLVVLASITGTTRAGVYNDIITVVCTGRY